MNIPNKIIIHHSATRDSGTVSWSAIRKYHTEVNGWVDIGYHYGIELVNQDYEIFAGRMEHVIGAHAAGFNTNSIGICVVGDYNVDHVSPRALHRLVRLVDSLMIRYGLQISNVYRHMDFKPTACPGKNFPWIEFKNMLVKGQS